MRWLPVAVVIALPVSGCVYHDSTRDHANVAYAGDITFQWSFPGGSTCSHLPDVRFIHVTLDGPSGPEPLDQRGWYNCTVAGFDGITLKNFDPATYTFTIDAYDSSQTVRLYSATGRVAVNGNITQSVMLNRIHSSGTIEISWKLMFQDQEISCAQASVSKVRVYINDDPPQDLGCNLTDANGHPVQGYAWEKTPGSYQVAIDGLAADGSTFFMSAMKSITLGEGQYQRVEFDLVPDGARGDINFKWSFEGGYSCADTAWAPYVHVSVSSPLGAELLENNGWFGCRVAGVDGIVLMNFSGGPYSFTIDAYDERKTLREFSGTGTVYVDGNVTKTVVLHPTQ